MAVQIGSMSPRETHDSREIERLRNGRLTTVRYNGSYAALKGMQPRPGQSLDGGTVRTSVLRRLQGGAGLLEYTVAAQGSTTSGGAPDPFDQIEIEMAQTERPIMSLPAYSGYGEQIEMWRGSPAEIRGQLKYVEETNAGPVVKSLTGDAPKVARLIMRGIESVLVFHPVATLTTESDERPAEYGRDIGRRGAPPVSGYPGGYEWLKTGDRLSRGTDGSWKRVQQWTGAAADLGGWEHELYKGVGE